MKLNYSRTGATGLIYDGVNLSDAFQVVDVSLPLLPTISANTLEMAQRPGAYFASRKVGTREIKVKLRLDAESRNPFEIFKAWRDMSGLFDKKEPKRLQLDETRYCNALLVGDTEIEDEAYYGVIEMKFICFDPYFYGTEHAVSLANGTAATFDVKGAVEAYPRLELTASTTAVVVTDMVSGRYVRVPGTQDGSSVKVDMERQHCTIGNSYAPVDLLSDFFAVSGEAQVKVEGASGTLRYKERYL